MRSAWRVSRRGRASPPTQLLFDSLSPSEEDGSETFSLPCRTDLNAPGLTRDARAADKRAMLLQLSKAVTALGFVAGLAAIYARHT
jgi:hypothetical protein